MIIASGGGRTATLNGNNDTPAALDCSTSPTNTSATSEASSNGLSTQDLAALLFKQNLFKQEMYNPLLASMNDPTALFTLSQLFNSQPSVSVATSTGAPGGPIRTTTTQAAPTAGERKRPYPCSFQFCVICQKDVHSSKLPCHIRQCHVAKPMFQCPACDFTSTYSKNNVKSHMVSLHGLAGDPISYMDKYAAQVEEFMKMCFPNVRGRGRPHTGTGRTSPNSPSSPNATGRRASQGAGGARRPSVPAQVEQAQQQIMAVVALQQARQAESAAAANYYGLSPLLFSQHLAMNKLPLLPTNNNVIDYKPTFGGSSARTLASVNMESMDQSNQDTPVSTGQTLAESVSSVRSNSGETPPTMVAAQSTALPSSTVSGARVLHSVHSKYLDFPTLLHAIAEEDVSGTVFKSFSKNRLMEKIDLSIFDGVTAQEPPVSLLNREQAAKVSQLRDEMREMQLFEILYAINRLDLSVLDVCRVDMVAEIAPSVIDQKKFKQFEESNATNNLTENDYVVLQLSKIERIEEKLLAMQHMGHFRERLDEATSLLSRFVSVSKSLRGSAEFAQMIELVLTVGNVLNGDYNVNLIHGFRTSDLPEIASFTVPGGRDVMSFLVKAIRHSLPELLPGIDRIIQLLEQIENFRFSTILDTLHKLQEGNSRTERETQQPNLVPAVAEFLANAQSSMTFFQEQIAMSMDTLNSMFAYFGEPAHLPSESFAPETFFAKILSFYRNLREHLCNEGVCLKKEEKSASASPVSGPSEDDDEDEPIVDQ